jgi:hypothetical protein
MLLPLLVFAQLATVVDSTYSSEALRALVSRATVANHAPPPSFRGYRAHVESEMSLLMRDTLGRERAAQLEQLASSIQWQRGGTYDMHVVGYRAQGLGSPVSTLSFIRGWTEPSLFGERLRLGALFVGDSVRRDSTRTDTIVVVHPFASDRDRFYRFAGGDTVTVLRTGTRAISVVRVHVTPWLRDSTRLGAFDGEIDLDAERGQIVRMRGGFVVLGPPRKGRRPLMARMPGLLGVAYCEFVNTEVNGQYWLPAFQRTELQSTFALMGHSRAVMRILSTFSNYDIEDRCVHADHRLRSHSSSHDVGALGQHQQLPRLECTTRQRHQRCHGKRLRRSRSRRVEDHRRASARLRADERGQLCAIQSRRRTVHGDGGEPPHAEPGARSLVRRSGRCRVVGEDSTRRCARLPATRSLDVRTARRADVVDDE